MATLRWTGDDSFELGHASFWLRLAAEPPTEPDHFLLAKRRHMVDRYVELLADLAPKQIVELGIFQGGSAAFLSEFCEPDHLAMFDLKDDPTLPLEDFLDRHVLRDRVTTHYGFDQADAARLRATVAAEFPGPLDLVIDDASHRLVPTRASFDVLFPLLRPGGVYIVEDWSGLHRQDAALMARALADPELWERLGAAAAVAGGVIQEVPLSVLLFEVVLAAAYAPDVFAEVVIAEDWAHIVRGPGPLEPATFAISQAYPETMRQLLGLTG